MQQIKETSCHLHLLGVCCVLLKCTRSEVDPAGLGVRPEKQGCRDALQACWGSLCGHSDFHPTAMRCGFSSSHPKPSKAQGGDPLWSCLRQEAADLRKAATLRNVSEATFSS